VGEAFIEAKPAITGEDRALGLVDFSIFPHVDHPGFDQNTMACTEKWASEIGGPTDAHPGDRRRGRGDLRGQLAPLCRLRQHLTLLWIF